MAGTSRPRAASVAAPAVVAVALVLGGCAERQAGTASSPPKLHIAGDVVAAKAPLPAAAGGTTSGLMPIFDGYVLAGSLPTQPTHAAVWRWPATKASAADVSRLGKAFGVSGTPQRHPYGWLLASSAGELRVREGAGEQWSFARGDIAACAPFGIDIDDRTGGGFGCATASATGVVAPVSNDPSSGVVSTSPGVVSASPGIVSTSSEVAAPPSAVAIAPTPMPAPTPTLPPPGPDANATRSAAEPVLAALGISGSVRVDVEPGTSMLTVAPTLDSVPTEGIETRIDVDVHGISAAMGWLARPTVSVDYPLRTAKQAFEDLANRPRPMMAPYCAPLPSAPAGGPVGAPAETSAPCPTPEPVRITGAAIGLMLSWDDDPGGGSPILVPAWFFHADGSDEAIATIAIDPRYLAPPAMPSTKPIESSPSVAPGPASATAAGTTPSAGLTTTSSS